MKQRPRKILFISLLIIALFGSAIGFFVYHINKTNVSFPLLPPGAYFGEISALGGQRHNYSPLLIESSADGQQLLIIVFMPNWVPQLAKLVEKKDFITNVQAGDGPAFEPPILKTEFGEFKLYGKDRNGYFKGKVLRSDGLRGAWKITPVAEGIITRNAELLNVYGVDLSRWLKISGEIRYNQDTLSSMRSILSSQERNNANMESHIIDQNQLKERAQKQRDLVSQEINNGRNQQKALTKEITILVDQLALVNRISKRGRLVSLARQISTRENKWYLANWQGQEEIGGFDNLGGDLNIDMTRLNEQSKHAQEVIALKDEISREKQKMQELRKEMAKGVSKEQRVGETAEKRSKPTAKPKEESGFFERIFGF
ncbi:MAG: hypothetical protein IT292_00810 [Deltaproteobacteria bacterium]|nr:hypothetical protein [Deltaproteobacteria bacterium]